MRIQLLTGSLSRWALDRFSIRLRLAIWYAMLVAATLALFSVIVFAVAQFQIENSVDQGLQSNAQIIARTVQVGLASPPSAVPGVSSSATATSAATPSAATPSATPSATPAGTATSSPSANGTATPSPTATPVPSIDPSTKKKIQQRLELSSVVTDLLSRLNLTFEVLDANHTVVYSPSNLAASPLVLDATSLRATLRGACMATTRSQPGSTLRIYFYPLTLPAAGGRATVNVSGPTSCTVAAGTTVVGVVVVAKTVDDVNTTLSTLQHLLFAGVLVALLLASLGAWFIAGNGLRPIASLTRTARSIATNAQRGGLGKRVGYRGPRDEVGELAATFDDMLAALERTANAQRRFIADASHELRAPLTTIKGSLELLRTARDLPESERAGALEDAYAEAARMAGLVNDLLLLARVDTAAASGARLDDQMRGRRELVELDQLAFEIFRQGRVQVQAQPGTHVQLGIGALEPLAAEGDPGQLRQVLLILLDNALKYTPAGGRVRISVSQEGGRAALSVADTGIGIEPEVLPHIFERFFRGDMARERDEHGSGLGLAIAEWIVTAHGGEMRVESRPGIGSTFTILLPAMRRQGEQSSAKQAVPPPRRGRGVARAFVAGAVAPLARLASSASRPRRLGRGPNEAAAPTARHADAPESAARADGPKSSEPARQPRPRPNNR